MHLVPTWVLDQPLLDLVQHYDRGLIRYTSAVVNVARLIAQVAAAWPEKTLAVVVFKTDQAWRLAKALRGLLPYVSVVTAEDKPAMLERVVVTTDTGLRHVASCPASGVPNDGPSVLNIVIALDAQEFVDGRGLKWLTTASNVRVYGLLASDAKPSRLLHDLINAVFGFTEAVIPGHGARVRPVRVVHYGIEGDLQIPRPRDGGTYTMAMEWRGLMLQPKVVQVATAFCENRRSELAELLPGIERVLNETRPPRVLAVAENLELALSLARQLPDWSFLVCPEVPLDCLPREQGRRIHELPSPSWTGPVHAVATADALGVGDLSQFDVLIRADGGIELPRFIASNMVEHDFDAPRPLVIVDCGAWNHPRLRPWSERRLEGYEEAGWLVPGRNPVMIRVERFLATRPRRKGR